MVIDIDTIFKYKTPDKAKLINYGFLSDGNRFTIEKPIMDNQFSVAVTVNDNTVSFTVIENNFFEEYTLVNVENAGGRFIGDVCECTENILKDISESCFITEIFKAHQTKRMLDFIKSEYGVTPEYLWEKSPDCAALRIDKNRKWFAVIMTVEKSKFILKEKGTVEIIALKAKPETVLKLIENDNFYPAYHMNKKYWFTVCLDGSISDKLLFSLIKESYNIVDTIKQ